MFIILLLLVIPCSALLEGDIKVFYNQVIESYGNRFAEENVENIEVSIFGGSPEKSLRWPNGIVPYIVDHNSYNEKEIDTINNILRKMTQKLAPYVTIIPRVMEEENYVMIGKFGQGCWSYLGMIGGMQQLSLGCSNRISVKFLEHEMMHVLGFWHEQSRNDRDDYVKINYENIDDRLKTQFSKRDGLETYGYRYDIKSVMHYTEKTFSSNGKKTIESINPPGVTLGNTKMSPIDIVQVRAMYGEPPIDCSVIKHRKICKINKQCRWIRRKRQCINI